MFQLEAFDLLIAASALAHDVTLVTENRREFDRIPGLTVESPNCMALTHRRVVRATSALVAMLVAPENHGDR